jgi:hypothetical protein
VNALPRSASGRFALTSALAALVCGAGASWHVLFEPGVVGLTRDWSVAPAPGQMVATASQLFDGWYRWTLGFPVVYPTDYLLVFALGFGGAAGMTGAVLSKAVVFLGPALACVCAMVAARALRLSDPAATVCGLVYALSPVALNKLVSGQLTFIFGYALLPLALAAYADACRRRRWLLGGLGTGAALALAAIQIQLGFIALLLLAFAALTWRYGTARVRFATLAVAAATLALIEAPVIVGLTTNLAPLGQIRAQIRTDPSWITSNSAMPDEALKLAGYIVAYDLHAVAGWYLGWSVAAYAVAALAFAGMLTATGGLRVFSIVAGAVALLIVTGVYSPFATAILWVFAHVSFSHAFLELYDVMAALALIYAIGVGACWDALRGRFAGWVKGVAVLAVAAFVAPMLTGNGGGLLQAHPYDGELVPAYALLANQAKRTVWFPMDQPLAFEGRGAGVEPMSETAQGSLWKYSLAWPLTAVDMDARSHDWDGLKRALAALSVGTSVERSAFDSKLYLFLLGAGTHTYLEPRLRIPPLSGRSTVVGAATRIDEIDGALPIAYGADGLAIVPRRLGAIATFADTSLVPVAFEDGAAAGVPYVVLRDRDDAADEALATARVAPLALPTTTIYATQAFAPLGWWWWDRPEFSDVADGILAYGQQQFATTVERDVRDAVVEVAWIASPVGGRFRLTVNGHVRAFDTNAPAAAWRSTFVAVGGVDAGATLGIEALDPAAAVAIRAVRVVAAADAARARAEYAALLRGASAVVDARAAEPGPYRVVARGASRRLGRVSFRYRYRLRVRTDRSHGPLMVYDAKDNLVAYAGRAVRGTTYDLAFEGIDDRLRLSSLAPVVAGWTLSAAPYRGAAPAANLARWRRSVTAGRVDGTSATFAPGRRIAVLNVAYSSDWRGDVDPTRHLRTALGTNAWIVAADATGARVADRQTPLFHFAFVLGALVFALAAVCGLGGDVRALARTRRRAVRPT